MEIWKQVVVIFGLTAVISLAVAGLIKALFVGLQAYKKMNGRPSP